MLARIAHEKHAIIFLDPMQELAVLSSQDSIRRERKAASVRPAALHFASDARLRTDRPDSANPALRRRRPARSHARSRLTRQHPRGRGRNHPETAAALDRAALRSLAVKAFRTKKACA
jgi:hypothetical protein